MTNPHRSNRGQSPEHRKSMKDIHLGIEKKNRLNRIAKLKSKLALHLPDHEGDDDGTLDESLMITGTGGADASKFKKQPRLHPPRSTNKFNMKRQDGILGSIRENSLLDLNENEDVGGNQTYEDTDNLLNFEDRKVDVNNFLGVTRAVKINNNNIGRTSRAKLSSMKQKLAVRFTSSFSPDLDAIDAFKRGEDYQGYVGKGKKRRLKFEVKNGELKLLGHTIAKHTPKGIEVNNAGFDTNLTYASIKELGINAKKSTGGPALLHNTEVDPVSGQKVLVPHNEISDKPIRITKKQPKRIDSRRTVTEQTGFRKKIINKEFEEQNRKTEGELPLSKTTIQPKDQRSINKITGVKSKIPKETRGTEAHHILPVKKFPGLRNNPANGIMQTTNEHLELGENNPAFLRSKLAIVKVAVKLRAFTNSSSFVGNMRYDQEEQSITGILSGKHYKWCGVPESKFDSFEGAGSAGAFFNRELKAQYDCGSGGILNSIKSKLSRLKSKSHVTEGMIQLAKNQSADSIINAFTKYKSEHPDSIGSGVYDPIENRILDARIPVDAIRLQRLFESGTNKVGFNSITDTRQGPATDIEMIRSQLKQIEQAGGLPALGFDEGSLEALDVTLGSTDDEIFSKLKDHQNSTAILDGDTTFRIEDNPKFIRN